MNFKARNRTREKNWSDFVAYKMQSGAKREWFLCSYRWFLEIEDWVLKKILWARHFKTVFLIFLVKRFDSNFVLILGWFW